MSQRISKRLLSDRDQKLLLQCFEAVREWIHADYKKAPSQLRAFLLHIERELFRPEFSISTARRVSSLKGNNYSARFCQLTGLRPRDYVEHYRIKAAQKIIRQIPLYHWEVASIVGFSDPSVFSRSYKRVLGYPPTEEEKKPELCDTCVKPSTSDSTKSFVKDPGASPNTAEITEESYLNLRIFWGEIGQMSRSELRSYLLGNLEQLDLDHHHYLLEKAKYEGRVDRLRGQEICLAALDVLKLVEFQKSLEFPDEKALAYATLANMCRLRFDFDAARDAFQISERLLPGDPAEKPLIFAQVNSLKVSLLWWQRDFEGAIELHSQIMPIIRASGSKNLLARSLILAAEIYDHWGHPEKAIPFLAEALEFTRQLDDSYLVFSAHFNLTHLYAKSGKVAEARRSILHVRSYYRSVERQIGAFHMTYLEGLVCQVSQEWRKAEWLFLEAREGFLNRKLDIYAALVALELATLYLFMGKSARAREMAASAVAPISRIGVHREAVAALAVLQETERQDSLNQASIEKAMFHLDRVRKDPAVNFLTQA